MGITARETKSQMHMVLLVFRTSLEDEVLEVLDGEQVHYTRLEKVRGKGATGIAPGSVTFGGANTIIWTTVPQERLDALRGKIAQFDTDLKGRNKVAPPFHVFVLPCMQWC